MAPAITVCILNYQRKQCLRRSLEAVLAQSYPALEILVVDNASTDGSAEMVRQDFPRVKLLQMRDNLGCSARNHALEAADSDIVVTLDNDVILDADQPGALAAIAETFSARARLACMNFKILDSEGRLSQHDWCHPRDFRRFADEEFPTDYVLEGACALRRSAFRHAGGYWAPLFLGHEGLDLALRFLDDDYELIYSPQIRVTHLISNESRPPSRIYYNFTRNSIWLAIRHHRPWPAARAVAYDLGLMAFSSIRAGQAPSYLRGLADGLLGSTSALKSRRPLKASTYDKLRSIRSLEPSFFQKARRHWQEQPI